MAGYKRNNESIQKLKNDQELNNPCLKEHNFVMKCLSDNNYNKDSCEAYFMNYRACKKFWNNVMKDRKRKGIKPQLPEPAERESIKNTYLNSMKK